MVGGNLITEDNKFDLERTQKSFCKLVLEEDYKNYENALSTLHLETLDFRRKKFTLNFAKTSLADGHFHDLIKKKKTREGLHTRKKEHYNVTFAHTDRFRRSPTLTMQRLTNQDHQDNLQ